MFVNSIAPKHHRQTKDYMPLYYIQKSTRTLSRFKQIFDHKSHYLQNTQSARKIAKAVTDPYRSAAEIPLCRQVGTASPDSRVHRARRASAAHLVPCP